MIEAHEFVNEAVTCFILPYVSNSIRSFDSEVS